MRPTLVCAFWLVIAGSIFFVMGQERQQEKRGGVQTADSKSTSDQIEVKTDRFSGVTTVKLKPQVILDKPDHRLLMAVETKLGDKKSFEWEMGTISAYARLESHYNRTVDYGDQELHLIIDSKPLNLDKTAGGTPSESTIKPNFRSMTSFVTIVDRSGLEQISKGKHFEMRFGKIEMTLDQPIVTALREYATQVLLQDKNTRSKKP